MSTAEKKVLRRALIDRRRALGESYRSKASVALCDKLLAHPLWQAARTVFAYCPVGDEPQLTPLWEAALKEGKTLCFPRCEGKEMRFCAVGSLLQLSEGAYGIPAPPFELPSVSPDAHTLCIVPALSADARGVRIGYGGGFYDRFLQKNPALITVCCLYHEMLSPDFLTREAHDVPVTYVITER